MTQPCVTELYHDWIKPNPVVVLVPETDVIIRYDESCC